MLLLLTSLYLVGHMLGGHNKDIYYFLLAPLSPDACTTWFKEDLLFH